MAKMTFGLPGIDYTATASSEDSAHPATNLLKYATIHEDYRSTVITAVNIVFDLGAAYSNVKLAMDGCNFTDFNLQANATDSWGSPTIDDDLTQIAKGWVQPHPLISNIQHRYGYFWEPSGFTSLQYIRLAIDAQTPTDGADHFRIGRIAIMQSSALLTLVQNPSWDVEEGSDSPTGKIEYPGGGSYYSEGDDLRWHGSIQWNPFKKANISDTQTLNSIPKDYPIVFFLNSSGNNEDFYFCRRESAFQFTHQSLNAGQITRVDFVEAL